MMKPILVALFSMFSLNFAMAKCASSGMRFFPEQKEISLNSMFIIQGYGTSQETVKSFKNRMVYLQDTNGYQIKLILQSIFMGDYRITQAVFKSEERLCPNTIYLLKYSNQTTAEEEEMMVDDNNQGKMRKKSWKTGTRTEASPINSHLDIQYHAQEFVSFGCGPSVNAVFNFEKKTKTEVWFKTEVLNIVTNKTKLFYIKAQDNQLLVGHDMCSGAFALDKEKKYKVRFTFVNAEGKEFNTTKWYTI